MCAYGDMVDIMKSVMKTMTPEQCVIIWSSPDHVTDMIEEYYQIHYSITQFIPTTIVQKFQIPPTNPFMPTNFDMVTSKQNLHVIFCTKYNKPEICVTAQIVSPYIESTCVNHLKACLYTAACLQSINSEIYLCEMADYTIDCEVTRNSVMLNISGYSDKIEKVIELVLGCFAAKYINPTIFESVKFSYKNSFENAAHNAPYKKIGELFNKTKVMNYYDSHDKLAHIDEITYESVMNTWDDICGLSEITVLVGGNVCDGSSIGKMFELSITEYQPPLGNVINNNSGMIIPVESDHETNSAMGYYVAVKSDNWIKSTCLTNLLLKIMHDKYFDALRTKEEFGYIVGASTIATGTGYMPQRYIRFIVQSPHKTCQMCVDRTSSFIYDFKTDVYAITDDEFDQIRTSVWKPLTCEEENLKATCNQHWIEIYYKINDYKQKMISIYQSLTKNDLIDFYCTTFIDHYPLVFGYEGHKKIN